MARRLHEAAEGLKLGLERPGCLGLEKLTMVHAGDDIVVK